MASAPNRVRNKNPYLDNISKTGIYPFGTLAVRRTYTNNTGVDVSRLRFRIVDITAWTALIGDADLSAISSPGETRVPNGLGQFVDVLGTQLENSSMEARGGGFNATLSSDTITPANPLKPGETINVDWLLGLRRTGNFRFYVNIEALP